MADYTGNSSLNLIINNGQGITNKLSIGDTSDYLTNGFTPGPTWKGYVTRVVSPQGVILYSNPVSSGVPDINESYGTYSQIDLPRYDNGDLQVGNYIVDLTVTDGSDSFISSKIYTVLGYNAVTPEINVDIDTVTPKFKVEDVTDYAQADLGDILPSAAQSTRLITINFPDAGTPNLTGPGPILETASFFTQTQLVSLTRLLVYAVGQNSGLFITDYIEIDEAEYEVIPIGDLCAIYSLVNCINKDYQEARKNNQTLADRLYKKWNRATGLLILIREAAVCGDTTGLDSYADEIEELSGECDCGCGDNEGDPIQVQPFSVTDNNTVTKAFADDADGTNFSFTVLETTQFVAFFEHNKQYTPVESDYDDLWIRVTSETNASALTEDVTSNLGESLGGIDDGETISEGTTFTEFVKSLLNKIFYPTLTSPTFGITLGGSYLQKIGSTPLISVTINFNRGQILGSLSGGVWNPNLVQDFRAGAATNYTIEGVDTGGPNSSLISKAISQGLNSYDGLVVYGIGPQPTDSAGENYQTPFPAGTSALQSANKEGVYPLFATTVNITTATEQSLVSMLTGNNIQYTLFAESGGNKQFFDIPNAWLTARPITKVENFNTLSGQFDTTNRLSEFTQSAITHTIESNTINYTRFTHNGSNRGSQLIKIIF